MTAPLESSLSKANPAQAKRPGACLLCGQVQLAVTESMTSAELRKAWRALGVNFSDASWRLFSGVERVELFGCQACGFRFCDPRLAGDGQFYTELEQQRTSYYPADVPEFTRTLGWAKQYHLASVLDVGCGDGAFLDRAKAAGMKTAGVELNLKAAEACRRKGHQVYTQPLVEVGRRDPETRYDLVTLFQVVEHVPDPVGFVSQAAVLVRPGGYLSVAVPNERGVYRLCPQEPHEWPPHHISRWRLADLERIGSLCGLKVIESGANRLLGGEVEHFWKLHNQIALALGRKPHPGGRVLPKVVSLFYRKLGLRYFVRGLGTSVYAFYQRPLT